MAIFPVNFVACGFLQSFQLQMQMQTTSNHDLQLIFVHGALDSNLQISCQYFCNFASGLSAKFSVTKCKPEGLSYVSFFQLSCSNTHCIMVAPGVKIVYTVCLTGLTSPISPYVFSGVVESDWEQVSEYLKIRKSCLHTCEPAVTNYEKQHNVAQWCAAPNFFTCRSESVPQT